ncbi:MAG: hypothetical protein D6809_05815 [Gammaproteobacteria bacterium]|nr:MAG: hypothetical protein D6809_05815 [Gammaproteobacteria bacterium]
MGPARPRAPAWELVERRPWRRRLAALLAFLLAGGAGWGLFEYGRWRAGYDSLEASRARTVLAERVLALERERDRLRREVAYLRQARAVDRQAYARVEASLVALQDEVAELKQEVAFYRGIVAPGEAREGVRVQRLRLRPGGAPGAYGYELVLSQPLARRRRVSGYATLLVHGLQDGRPRSLSLRHLGAGRSRIRFRFRYFQASQGELQLPAGFTPTRVVVRVDVLKPKARRIERAFAWEEVAGPSGGPEGEPAS